MKPSCVKRLANLFLAASVFWPARVLAQQSREIVPSAHESATLMGTVLADDTGRPVGRALVTVHGVVPVFGQVVSTDVNGHFGFVGLPVGDVTVTAAKVTYLTAFYGAHDPIRGPAIPFRIGGGAPVDIVLRLVRGGVIAGTVTGPTGRPQPGTRVAARQSRLAGVTRHFVGGPVGEGGVTDDRGHYRIWGLAPGEYVLEATPADTQTAARSTSDADVRWATAEASGTRGTTHPRAGAVVRFAPVYYPGTIDESQVAPVTVHAGEERDGVNVTLQTIQMADLRGTLLGTDGQPVAHEGVTLDGALEQLTTITDEAGGFEFRAVAPGSLTLSARGSSRRVDTANIPAPQDLWASTDLIVNGDDQTGLTLTLRPGMTAVGRVAFEGPGVTPDPSRALVALSVVGDRPGGAKPAQAKVAADGSFAFSNLAPGRYHIHPGIVSQESSSSSGPWLAKSVFWQGQDLLDSTLEVTAGQDISGITVVFSDRPTDLQGTFLDSEGRPVAGYDVVIFAADRGFWVAGSRRTQHVLLGHDGHFDFANLPAGEYLLAAVTHVETDELTDPDWLNAVAPLALRVTLADGEHKVQDIRLGR